MLDVSHYTETNHVIYRGSNTAEVAKGLEVNLPKNKVMVVHKDKIVTRNRRITRQEIADKSKELAIEIYRENPDKFIGLTPYEVNMLMSQLINEKMLDPKPSQVKTKMEFIIQNIEESDSEESEYSDEEYSGSEDYSESDEEIPFNLSI
jgi:hypothetical protein